MGLTFSGCSYLQPYKKPLTQGTVIDKEAISTLQKGLSEDQVISLLGPPFGKNPYNPRHWEYVFYTSDPELHPDAAQHLIVSFDQSNYVNNWYLPNTQASIIQQ